MLVAVPPPPWINESGNCSCQRPATISSAARQSATDRHSSITPACAFASAAAALTCASERSNSGRSATRGHGPGKFFKALTVWTPKSASSGTSTGPSSSTATRIGDPSNLKEKPFSLHSDSTEPNGGPTLTLAAQRANRLGAIQDEMRRQEVDLLV